MNETRYYDTTIIGGGPAGLFTAFYAGMRQMSVKIIESLPVLGGQLATLYPEKYIYDVAGFPKVKAQALVDRLIEQMEQFPVTTCLNETASTVEKMEDGSFKITTNADVHYTKSIIITAGNGAFQPRLAGVPNEKQYDGKNVHYFVNDMQRFKDEEVVVLGGGDSAVDWALMLEPIAKSVSLVHRRDKFRAHEHSVAQLHESNVEIVTPYRVSTFEGEPHVERITITHSKDQEDVRTIETDHVLVNYGFVSSLGPLKEWSLDIDKNSIVVNEQMETSIPGIFAVGDVCTYPGKVKLIATGFGEAPIAVSHAKVRVDPDAKVQPLHSTSIMGE